MTTLEALKDAKEKALAEYKTKEKDLSELRKELIKLGAIEDESTSDESKKGGGGRKSGGKKRGPQVKKADKIEKIKSVLKGGKSLSVREIAEATGFTSPLGGILKEMKKDLTTTGGGSPKDPTKYALK